MCHEARPSPACRFEWPAVPNLTISPSIGHISAGSVKDITVTFRSSAPAQLKAQAVVMKGTELRYPGGVAAVADWDNRRVEGAAGPEAEPKVELVTGKGAEVLQRLLKVSYVRSGPRCYESCLSQSMGTEVLQHLVTACELTASERSAWRHCQPWVTHLELLAAATPACTGEIYCVCLLFWKQLVLEAAAPLNSRWVLFGNGRHC